jgi:hypothetical protein
VTKRAKRYLISLKKCLIISHLLGVFKSLYKSFSKLQSLKPNKVINVSQ